MSYNLKRMHTKLRPGKIWATWMNEKELGFFFLKNSREGIVWQVWLRRSVRGRMVRWPGPACRYHGDSYGGKGGISTGWYLSLDFGEFRFVQRPFQPKKRTPTGVLHGQGEVTTYTKQSEIGKCNGIQNVTHVSTIIFEGHSAVTQNGVS